MCGFYCGSTVFPPAVIKKMLQRVAVNLDDRLVVAAFSPIMQSVRSWLIAKRLSINYNINPAARIEAQCMLATVSASQPPPDVQAPAILMQQLRIDGAHTLKNPDFSEPLGMVAFTTHFSAF